MNKYLNLAKSKTFWVALIGALLTVIEVNSGFFGNMLPTPYRTALLAFWPVIMIVMRSVTTTALSDK